MFNKKRLLILVLVMLIISVVVSGCIPGKEAAGQKIVDELIEEGAPTMPPTPTPKPTPTPTPEKVGFHFSDEDILLIDKLWPAENSAASDFGSLYAIYGDNDWMSAGSYVTFEYRSDESVDQLKGDFGQPIFGQTLDGLYYSGTWTGETNSVGEPLKVSVSIGEMLDYSMVQISFTPGTTLPIVDDLHNKYWPTGWHQNGVLPEEDTLFIGFGFYPGTQGIELWRSWSTPQGEAMQTFNGLEAEFADRPDFESIPEDGYIAPRISYTYDINGDGKTMVDTNIIVYDSADMIQVSFSARVEY